MSQEGPRTPKTSRSRVRHYDGPVLWLIVGDGVALDVGVLTWGPVELVGVTQVAGLGLHGIAAARDEAKGPE